MASIDGVMAVPKGLKREARRLVVIAFLLAPIGGLAAVAAVGVNGKTAANLTSTPGASTSQSPEPSLASPATPPVAEQNTAQQSSNHLSSSIELHTNQTAPGSVPTTQLQVNQQSISVPTQGTVHKVISNDSGTTTLDISNSSSSVNDSSSSSTSIQVNTSSSSSTNSSSETSTGP